MLGSHQLIWSDQWWWRCQPLWFYSFHSNELNSLLCVPSAIGVQNEWHFLSGPPLPPPPNCRWHWQPWNQSTQLRLPLSLHIRSFLWAKLHPWKQAVPWAMLNWENPLSQSHQTQLGLKCEYWCSRKICMLEPKTAEIVLSSKALGKLYYVGSWDYSI